MKRHLIRRIFCLFLCACLLPGGMSARAAAAAAKPALVTLADAVSLPEGPEIVSDYAVLIEARSGAILYDKNARERSAPASITKIMTALLIMASQAGVLWSRSMVMARQSQ